MVEFENFVLSAPPYTGIDWFKKASIVAGLSSWQIGTFFDPPSGYCCHKLSVSLVRHPARWLKEVHTRVHRYLPVMEFMGYPNKQPVFLYAKDLEMLIRQEPRFDLFVLMFSRTRNVLWELFRRHRAGCVLRVEDFPYSGSEFLISAGGDKSKVREIHKIPVHDVEPFNEPRAIWNKILESEPKLCQAYNYF